MTKDGKMTYGKNKTDSERSDIVVSISTVELSDEKTIKIDIGDRVYKFQAESPKARFFSTKIYLMFNKEHIGATVKNVPAVTGSHRLVSSTKFCFEDGGKKGFFQMVSQINKASPGFHSGLFNGCDDEFGGKDRGGQEGIRGGCIER